MLILKQKAGESIALGENIQIHVLSVKAGQVRLGIEAPPEIKISRKLHDGCTTDIHHPMLS